MHRRGLFFSIRLLILPALSLAPGLAPAFGEEHGSDIDTREAVSSHHLYLTRALAVCAGLPGNGRDDPFDQPGDAERIAIADQLADSEHLQRRDGNGSFSLCRAGAYRMPTPKDLGCAAETGTTSIMPVTGHRHVSTLMPVPKWSPDAGCFASRFGPWSNDFHFPDAARLAVLRGWAFGERSVLSGTAHFSFGGWFDSPWNADCNAARAETIDTGDIAPGSPEAIGIYLHAIGDFHSHAECLAHWRDRGNPPWPTHTISTAQTGCAFIDHAREFGCPTHTAHDSLLTPPPGAVYLEHAEKAALEIHAELLRHARARALTPRLGEGPAQRRWLAAQVRRFVTGWSYLGGAGDRRAFANAIASTCANLQPDAVPADLPRTPSEWVCETGPAR